MPVFLLITLSTAPPFTYRQPLLQLVQEAAPDWVALDVDSFSDESLMGYAVRLVREADRVVAVFLSPQPDAPLGTCQLVLEEILQRKQESAAILQGSHRRLLAIFQARPHINWHVADTDASLQAQVRAWLRPA